MADFCLQCSNELFGTKDEPVESDFHGLLSKEQYEAGYILPVLCEGCGVIEVDHEGRCINHSNHQEYNVETTNKPGS